MRLGVAVLGLVVASAGAQVPSGQVPVAPNRTNIKTEAQLDDEAKQADALFQQSRTVETLPMYQELHEQRPSRVFYTERLALAYVAKSGTLQDPAAAAAARGQAKKLLLEAKAAGDNSDLLQVMLSKLDEIEHAPADKGPKPAGQATLEQAELAFNQGDMKGAMVLYNKAWAENPKLYSVALFAGDAEFRQNHFDEAGMWFQRAIAINPDLETAYRYWGDALLKAGKADDARKEYVAAFVAEPYAKAPRLTLRTWAARNGFRYVPPPIALPAGPTTGKDGHINITLDGSKANDPLAPSYLMYSMNAALWQGDKFKKEFPQEKVYRHSLAEEVDTLHLLLVSIREQKVPESKYDATVRSLMALEKDGMLECWILLDNPDQGVAQDYAAFRAQHRDLLKAYVEKYDLHPA
jgi:tetratricopeptide (TPR) repeat protein